MTISTCFVAAPGWTKNPTQTINYASCHDNNTLYDRIVISTPKATAEEQIRMNNLAAAIYMTSQGVPFVHAGEEMLRSKPLPDGGFDHNSYNNTDEVNNLKWADLNKAEYQTVYNYYKGLIAFRAAHPAFRMTSAEDVAAHITRLNDLEFNVTGFHIAAGANGEENDFIVIFNPKKEATSVTLPAGQWEIYVSGQQAGTEALGTAADSVTVEPISAMVLMGHVAVEEPVVETTVPAQTDAPVATETDDSGFSAGAAVCIVAAVIAAAGAVLVVLKKRKA